MKVYHPFLPVLFIVFGLGCLAYVLGPGRTHVPSPESPIVVKVESKPTVLAYATAVSSDGLLNATNQRRSDATVGSLSIDTKLTQAAQAKANDMATRNYWAHNTPEGTPPWTFITNAGYSYSRAGENLACGFNESTQVITGWYNSPSHRDNLLGAEYKHVGFGIANAANYNCGDLAVNPQTVVVAMYGTPYEAQAEPVPAPAPKVQSPATQPAAGSSNTPVPSDAIKTHTVIVTVVTVDGKPSPNTKVTLYSDPVVGYTDEDGKVTFKDVASGQHRAVVDIKGAQSEIKIDLTDAPAEYKFNITRPELASNQVSADGSLSVPVVESKTVHRLDLITSNPGWAAGILLVLILAGCGYIIVKHSLAAHRFFVKQEQYILKHKYIDVAVALLLLAFYFLTRSVGAVL